MQLRGYMGTGGCHVGLVGCEGGWLTLRLESLLPASALAALCVALHEWVALRVSW